MSASVVAAQKKTLVTRVRTVSQPTRRFGLTLLAVLIISLCLGGFFIKTWISHQTVRTGISINALRQEIRALEESHRQMTVELANLSSPMRIERIATKELGMKAPGPEQIVKMKDQ